MELSAYTLETLRQDREFILSRGRRDATVSARGDPGRGTPRARKPAEDRARLCLTGRAPSRVGRSAARPRPAPGAEHARARGSGRRALRSAAWHAAGARAVLAGRRRSSGRPRAAAQPGPDRQGPQAGPRPGQLSDRPGLADGLWHRLAAAARAAYQGAIAALDPSASSLSMNRALTSR
jgi:hypothetical protein